MTESRNRRGQRDADLAQALASAEEATGTRRVRRSLQPTQPEDGQAFEAAPLDPDPMLNEAGELEPTELPYLFEGDVLMLRISQAITLGTGDNSSEHWISGGVQSRVQPDEDPRDAMYRLREFLIPEIEATVDVQNEAFLDAQYRRAEEARQRRAQEAQSSQPRTRRPVR